MNECCGTCNYFCEVRKHPAYEEILTHICALFLVEENEGYILETTENDVCECYMRYKN